MWTGWIADALPCAGWEMVMKAAGFVDAAVANRVDTLAGAGGEDKATAFGYSIRAHKP